MARALMTPDELRRMSMDYCIIFDILSLDIVFSPNALEKYSTVLVELLPKNK